ncbi:hypothetical protein M1N85_04105, partial [Dehalococcoidia bacterium]|nr:hypothetical protein [Dehalococcoidia bacterium]
MKGSITARRIVGTLLVLTMILASVVVPGRSPVTAEAGGGAIVDLHLLPPDQTVKVGDTFDITIEARCGVQKVHAISAFLDFDPIHLEVVSITAGATLDVPLLSDWDNAAGTVDYSAGKMVAPFPYGTFDVAVVTFRAIAPTDSTAITFSHVSPRETAAVFGGVSVLNQTFDATVTVTPARYVLTVTVDPSASGNVTLAPEQPPDGYEAGTEVTLTAEPAPGWEFERWSGDVTGTEPTITLTMDADKSVTAHFTVEVVPPFDFSLTVYPTAAIVIQGEVATASVAVTHLAGPVEEVTLSHDLPVGVGTIEFVPPSATPPANGNFTSDMTISTAADATPGEHLITITGTGAGGLERTTTFTLTVEVPPPFDFSLTVYPTAAIVVQGEEATASVTAELLAGEPQLVNLTADAPEGITVTFVPEAVDPGFPSLMTITVAADVTPADYVITITGTSYPGGVVETVTFTLTVVPPFDFSLAVDPAAATLTQGDAVTTTVTATLEAGITEEVSLTYTLPDGVEGVTVTFDPVAGEPTFTSAMNITTTAVATVGVYPITIIGTAGELVKTTLFTLNVTALPFDFSLAVDPTAASVGQGEELTATVTATLDAGIAEDVTLTADAPAGINVTFAPAIGAPTFESTVTIAAAADAPLGDHVITITGTSYPGGVVETVTFTLTVVPPFDFSLAVDPTAATVTQG